MTYDGGGNVFFEPIVNILIFYCSSVVGSYVKKSVSLFQISQRSASSSSPPAAIWAGAGTSSSSVKAKPPIPVPGRPVSYV